MPEFDSLKEAQDYLKKKKATKLAEKEIAEKPYTVEWEGETLRFKSKFKANEFIEKNSPKPPKTSAKTDTQIGDIRSGGSRFEGHKATYGYENADTQESYEAEVPWAESKYYLATVNKLRSSGFDLIKDENGVVVDVSVPKELSFDEQRVQLKGLKTRRRQVNNLERKKLKDLTAISKIDASGNIIGPKKKISGDEWNRIANEYEETASTLEMLDRSITTYQDKISKGADWSGASGDITTMSNDELLQALSNSTSSVSDSVKVISTINSTATDDDEKKESGGFLSSVSSSLKEGKWKTQRRIELMTPGAVLDEHIPAGYSKYEHVKNLVNKEWEELKNTSSQTSKVK